MFDHFSKSLLFLFNIIRLISVISLIYINDSLAKFTGINICRSNTSGHFNIPLTYEMIENDEQECFLRQISLEERKSIWNNIYETALQEKIDYLPFDSKFEIDSSDLMLLKMLGGGYFADVHLGLLKTNDSHMLVAVKTPKSPLSKRMRSMSSTEREDEHFRQRESLRDELKIMSFLPANSNVVKLIGAVTTAKDDFCVVMEYCDYGGLDKFLRDKLTSNKFFDEMAPLVDSEGYISIDKTLTTKEEDQEENLRSLEDFFARRCNDLIGTSDLLWFALQIARAMSFLTKNMVLHRDVALRNVLLKADYTIRVADFGLSRQANDNGAYCQSRNIVVPFRYIAPEALRSGRFSRQSELWSFGVVLWEVFTFAKQQPYDDVDHTNCGAKDVAGILDYLDSGNRLKIPESMPKSVSNMTTTLWHEDPFQRPSFKQCQDVLQGEMMRMNPQIALVARLEEKNAGIYVKNQLTANNSTLEGPSTASEMQEQNSVGEFHMWKRRFYYILGLFLCTGFLFAALLLTTISIWPPYRVPHDDAGLAEKFGNSSQSGCPNEWFPIPTTSKCIRIIPDKKTWFEANESCVIDYGGHLLSIGNDADHHIAVALAHINPKCHCSIWIGGKTNGPQINSTQDWFWSDGSEFQTYMKWQEGEPNNGGSADCPEECLELIFTIGQWNNNCCSIQKAYVCELFVSCLL